MQIPSNYNINKHNLINISNPLDHRTGRWPESCTKMQAFSSLNVLWTPLSRSARRGTSRASTRRPGQARSKVTINNYHNDDDYTDMNCNRDVMYVHIYIYYYILLYTIIITIYYYYDIEVLL